MLGQAAVNTRVGMGDEPTSLLSRSVLVAFCLAAGVTYRVSVSLLPQGLAESAFLLGLAALLLGLAQLARRDPRLNRYWEIPFAFFVFTVAGFFGDGSISSLQRWFVANVLHQAASANNPLASTVGGTVIAQAFGTMLLAVPIIVLTRASRSDLRSIFLSWKTKPWGLAIAIVCFLAIYFLVARGRTASFFPTNGAISTSRLISLTPALIVLVLLNGFREELWFRGLFLNKYGRFLSPLASNALAAVIFTMFHVQVRYSASILGFLAYTLIIGLIAGWLMQRTNSIIAPAIFHAGTDIPIFLVYLSYAS